ncbi:MAG TPA: hypothetical protein VD931_08065 [Baekduia sp.]|nr:hypothetical protein [Baekduia sp.]
MTLEALRPKPFRGDQVAAGTVVLATLAVLLDARYAWARGADLAVLGLSGVFAATLAVRSPVEGRDPRAYQTVLFLATLVLLAAWLARCGGAGAGALAWKAAVVGAAATWFARRRGSGTCTLVASLAGGVAVVAGADAWLGWDSAQAVRRELLALTAGFALGAVAVRDRRPRSAAMLAVAGGAATLAIAATFALEALPAVLFGALDQAVPEADAGAGWQLLLAGAGFGLCALSGVEREPGPGYVGVLNLVAFVLLAADGGSLLGWPLVLAVGAAFLLAVGLRPARPLPPPPGLDDAAPPPAPLPLRPR